MCLLTHSLSYPFTHLTHYSLIHLFTHSLMQPPFTTTFPLFQPHLGGGGGGYYVEQRCRGSFQSGEKEKPSL